MMQKSRVKTYSVETAREYQNHHNQLTAVPSDIPEQKGLFIPTKEGLRWKKYNVLDQGFVCLVDWMGSDNDIADAARVSYRSSAKTEKDNAHLINFLLKHGHTSPFEMAELKFMVRVPMDTWRQWVRHRTASINEQSTRYQVIDGAMASTEATAWRQQSDTNRQGSGSPIDAEIGALLTDTETKLHRFCNDVYKDRIKNGVAREQARKDLPLSTYTQAYWKIDLHNLLHFLRLRLAPDAQWEIRQYAIAISGIVKALFPITWDAFTTNCLNSITLDGNELEILSDILKSANLDLDESLRKAILRTGLSSIFKDDSRSIRELRDKLREIMS